MTRLYLTVKAWSKWDDEQQQKILAKHEVILTDHRTKREKAIGIIKAINMKNFDRGMKVFDGAMKEFDGMMSDFGKELGGSTKGGKSTAKYEASNRVPLWGSEKSKKTASPKKKQSRKKTAVKSSNVDALMGKKKRIF